MTGICKRLRALNLVALPHFIHEMRTIAYDVIGVNVFLRTLMRILRKKTA